MRTTSIIVAAALLGAASAAHAAPALRVQVDQHGDFLLIGNTLGIECAAGTPLPVLGTFAVNACNQATTNVADSGPDLFWRADAPAAGQAVADVTTTAAQARSTAVLTVPAGGTVTHAYLYWGAESPNGMAGTTVTLDRIGANGFTQTVAAQQSFFPGVNNAYQSVADITSIVQQFGAGAYRVSGVSSVEFANTADNAAYAGWAMVVFYQRASDPLRNLAIFDGLDVVSNGNNQSANLSGFLVPNAGFTGKLGVIAYEGDNGITGDSLFFNGGAALSDAQNPVNNFFNGTRSNLGAAVSVVGDLPQLTGTPQSMGGIDLDVVDVTAKLSPGQTSAPVSATSTGDVYYLGAFITSVSTFKPDFTSSTKTGADVNGGSLLAGDVLQYTINVINTGNDASINTVLTDALPTGVTYVPGSITINGAGKTDMTGDDQADYLAATRTVVARLGVGANATMGGAMAINGTATVSFKVTVDAGFTGNLANQAKITAAGQLGAPSATTPTDGNGPAAGAPPTTVVVDQCATNADCMGATPACDTTTSPKTCVQCVLDADCGGVMSGKVCTPMHACIDGCRGAGGNGCPMTAHCTSMDATIGQCVECLQDSDCGGPMSGKVCDASSFTCGNGCRGVGGNGCPTGDSCTSMDATIGQCVDCLTDADCGGVMSGKVCDTTTDTCIDGCRGTGGNGCPSAEQCTSMDASIGQCVECVQDGDCGGIGSGKVCDPSTNQCIDGCRGTIEGNCPVGKQCTSMDASIGQCVECVKDADCGAADSGKVCDATTSACVDGCRGMGGNGCPAMKTCTSIDASIGQCVECQKDADCGAADSGKVCDLTTDTCVEGCRGSGGNGCPIGKHCTSIDATIGNCGGCGADSDCGDANSGKVCDTSTHTCTNGCRGNDGNGCPDGQSCSSTDNEIGTCAPENNEGIVPEGNGIACAAQPGPRDGAGVWLLCAAAAIAAARRRRRG